MAKSKPVDPQSTREDLARVSAPSAPAPLIAGKLFGLVKAPVTRFGYEFYFIVTATIDEGGNIVSVEKSTQSWFMWEALHKMERATELSLIDIQKTPEAK